MIVASVVMVSLPDVLPARPVLVSSARVSDRPAAAEQSVQETVVAAEDGKSRAPVVLRRVTATRKKRAGWSCLWGADGRLLSPTRQQRWGGSPGAGGR